MNWITLRTCHIEWIKNPYSTTTPPIWKLVNLGEIVLKGSNIKTFKEVYVPKYHEVTSRASASPFINGEEFACCEIGLENGTSFYIDITLSEIKGLLGISI